MTIILSSLFFTDLFIFLFKILIFFLNSFLPKSSDGVFISHYSTLAKPEYDIQIYFFLLIIFVGLVWLFHKLKKKLFVRDNKYIKTVTLVLLFLFFLVNLGEYPLGRSIPVGMDFLVIYITTVVVIILILNKFGNLFIKKNKTLYRLFFSIILLFIALSTFFSKFPVFYHDFSFIIGPILEIANGKTIFTQITSQYGFLSIIAFGYLKRFGLLEAYYLPIIFWILYAVQYFICFYLIYKISNSIILALISLFSILTVNYFSIMHPPMLLPQIGPFRWLPLIMSIYLFFVFKDIRSKKFIVLSALLSFIIVDSGTYLIIAFILTVTISYLHKQLDLKSFFKTIGWFFGSLLGIFIIINGVNLVLGYTIINPIFLFKSIRTYSMLGFGMLPVDLLTYLFAIVLLYFTAIIYYFNLDKPGHIANLLLFSSQIMIISAVYYVGRSHQNNLLNISIFFILTLSIFFGLIFNKLALRWKKPALILFFVLLVIFPAYNRIDSIASLIGLQIKSFSKNNPLTPEMGKIVWDKYNQDAVFINKNLKDKDVVIISVDDAYLFNLTKKNNLMDINPQISIITKDDLDFALKNVFQKCPQKIAVDCRIINQCKDYITLNGSPIFTKETIAVEKNHLSNIFDRIEKKCQFNYLPELCNNHFCIMKAQTALSFLR